MNQGLLICGLPGSGKTTLAKSLEVERKAIRLCPDEWIKSILKNQSDIEERDRLKDPVEQLLWRQAQILLGIGVNVILENGFWTRQERNIYLKGGKTIGSKVELHFTDAPFKVLWQRVEKRNSLQGQLQLTKKELEEWHKLFEPPTDKETEPYDYFIRH